MKRPRPTKLGRLLRHYHRRVGRHWRLGLALMAHRVERRLGRHLTDRELARLGGADGLALREAALNAGYRLVVCGGRIGLGPKRGAS